MASSQVEIASSPPFGCVLRDHNRRDEFRESKWRKLMVKDRLSAFVSINSDENENSWLPNTLRFAGNGNDRDGFSSAMIPKETARAVTDRADREAREEAVPRPDCPHETPNLGAASLVQIWEKRLKRSDSGDNPDPTAFSCNENAVSSVDEERDLGRGLETEHSVLDEEQFDSLPDWQSDRSAPPSEQPSPSRSQGSDSGESERVRVADIIKRLTAANQGDHSSDSERDREQSGSPSATGASDQTEQQRVFFQPALISPRIRGRQAFADLLMQMERERLSELNMLIERRAVSRFPQRGRIQSMLRLRSLQRGLAVQDRHRVRLTSSSSSLSQPERLPQGSSSITHLRERFSPKVEPIVTSRSGDADNPTSTSDEITKIGKAEKLENSSTSSMDEQKQNHEVISIQQEDTIPVHDLSARITEDFHEELGPSTSLTCQGTSSKDKNLDPRETSLEQMSSKGRNLDPQEPRSELSLEHRNFAPQEMSLEHRNFAPQEMSSNGRNLDPQEPCSELRKIDLQETSSESRNLAPQELSSESRSLAPQETSLADGNLDLQEAVNATEAITSFDCWDGNDVAEELEDSYLQYEEETGYDWISDISRPRSYWEDRRQEWYYEMLSSNSKNAEIRQLLERGTVTGFLASEFRERMDRLMTTRLERQTHSTQSQGEEEDDQIHLISLLHNSHERKQEEEPEEEIEDEEAQEQEDEQQEESLISGQFHEAGDYFDQSTLSMQIPSPPLLRTWSFQDNDVGDDSDRAASISPHQDDFPSQSYYQNAPQCSSSVNHPSIEMELICELRGQMEQLYREMSDLRKSLKSCMDMQMILMQRSMKQEVHSAAGEAKNKSQYGGAVPKKGHCCICYEMKVDSLLYRCGHMCTCLKCAHELQWSSGKCPICCAAIVDVVRAYLDS